MPRTSQGRHRSVTTTDGIWKPTLGVPIPKGLFIGSTSIAEAMQANLKVGETLTMAGPLA